VFTLIKDSDMWVISTSSQWIDYVLTEGTPVVVKKSGLVEPYKEGETGLILPSGIRSEDAVVIYTEHKLNVYNNIEGNLSLADLVSFKDPEINTTTFKYMVRDEEEWDANTSFTLIPSHHVYLGIRKEQQ
jgi:hypothetical protein